MGPLVEANRPLSGWYYLAPRTPLEQRGREKDDNGSHVQSAALALHAIWTGHTPPPLGTSQSQREFQGPSS
ncbi:hypothetical protein CGMCC3_g6380 [Colletotrichum fructicola]|nr:uncharacterized protein CGMCC3_g6380 [Colletotrichum fructicola]KAE9577724.1 hypothetical protein CGMCC3_g6380 [Colletotrichum fructicola]